MKKEAAIGSPERELNPIGHAKKRALKLLESGDLQQAIDSMVTDLNKITESGRVQMPMSSVAMMAMILKNDLSLDERKVQDFINGFND